MESRSFHVHLWEDRVVLRGQRMCRGLELEPDGHRRQGHHFWKQTARTMGRIKHRRPKTRGRCHFSRATSPRDPGNASDASYGKDQPGIRCNKPTQGPLPHPVRAQKPPPAPGCHLADRQRRDVNPWKTGHLPQRICCHQEKGLSLVIKFIWSPSASL